MIAFSVQLHIGEQTTTIADGYLSDNGLDLNAARDRNLIASMVSLWAAEVGTPTEPADD